MADQDNQEGGENQEAVLAPAQKSSEEYPRLEPITGPHEGLIFALPKGETLIGRSRQKANLRLEDTSVSRLHARIMVDEGGVIISDFGSRNGTVVHGTTIRNQQEQKLVHLDQIKVGIYSFRYVERPYTDEEANAHDAQVVEAKGQQSEASHAIDPSMSGVQDKGLPSEVVPPEDPEHSLVLFEQKKGGEEKVGVGLRYLFIAICFLSGLTGLIYYLVSDDAKQEEAKSEGALVDEKVNEDIPEEVISEEAPAPQAEAPKEEVPPPISAVEVPVVTQGQEQTKPSEALPQTVAKPATFKTFPAFLDITSEPMPARVLFEDRVLGNTPLKSHVDLVANQNYTLIAEFELRDLRDSYQVKVPFVADPLKEVFSFPIKGEIGMIKINKLPRHVHFYLEGYYAYDQLKANPVKLSDIIYGKPIFVPFGHYIIELREKTQIGDSQTFVDDIRYKREFDVNGERKEIELSILDRDLQYFPAKITSEPDRAALYLDGQKLGETPYEGEMPLGVHELKLMREGFFDYKTPLEMRINTPFETKITMKTSRVGEFINKAKELRAGAQYNEAINQLIEGLKLDPSDKEKSQIHLLVGDSYYMMNTFDQASVYFDQAKTNLEFYYRAQLGLARVNNALGKKNEALSALIEVMLNTKDTDTLAGEARSLFKQLSPLKSVIFITSEPNGATVFINSREVSQKTPMILSELSLGNYLIEIQKQGYQTQQVKKNLKLTEFISVQVTLTPEKL